MKPRPAYEVAYGPQKQASLNVAPYTLLRNPEVKQYIYELRKEAFDALQIDAMRVTEKLAEIAFSDKEDEIYTPANKLKALESLSKILGMQVQKIESTETIEVTLEDS